MESEDAGVEAVAWWRDGVMASRRGGVMAWWRGGVMASRRGGVMAWWRGGVTAAWWRPHHLADVVAPGQEQDARVVFLPVREDEGEQHHPQDVVQRGHAHTTLPTPKYGVDGGHEVDAGPTVQAVVKQLP